MAEGKQTEEEEYELEPNLNNIFEQESLKWVFVGGKGGVGKTTCSSSIAVELARRRKSVLIISTDPAHNLADAFAQPFGPTPTQVKGFDNLFAMEIEANASKFFSEATAQASAAGGLADMQSLIAELTSSIPGIDEAMSFAELMKQVDSMEYSTIVFDTAPTGHTLRLLGIPATLDRAMQKVMALKSRFSGLFSRMQDMMGALGGNAGAAPSEEMIVSKLEAAHQVVAKVNKQFMDPEATTFVCVCIPEFLSVYETERLVQELSNFKIDVRNIIINQVLLPEADSTCKKCKSRVKMQRKYIEHVYALYDLFHVTVLPLLDEEVRGADNLREFSKRLVDSIHYSLD
eukprot:TRINITY_DN5471_c0_g1_i1.p1 TRINITY_DN5471_c0_g1~~TRINITY_DN5471_c0_g1_i1.p1  ORF type:complete len:361 (+),score=113.66 TRINITY_DN5471_c0_g1_i1:51-1085(+)